MKKILNNAVLYAGLLIAFLLMLACFQLFVDADKLFGNKTGSDNYWLTFSKKITPDNIGRQELLGFSDAEVQKIKSWPEAKEVYPLTANVFKASANGGSFIPFYTDIYFEGVDKRAIDLPMDSVDFSVKNDEIPIVISREYLNLYNYGFALSQGLPQITEDFAKKITVNINITVKGRMKTYTGRLIGLSDRIHSVIIPKEFIDQLNHAEKPSAAQFYNRVLVQVKDSGDENLISKMQKNGYESNQESLRSAKIKSSLYLVLRAIAILGFLIFVLCLFNIINFIKIQFFEKQEEVSIKNSLGYSPKKMVADISRRFSISLAVVVLVSLILISAAQYFAAKSAVSNGLLLPNIHPLLWLAVVIFPVLVYFYVNWLIYRWLLRSWKLR